MDAWLPYFVLGEATEPSTVKRLGVPAGRRWAAMSTIPMGWLSPTGIMQHLAYRLTNEVRFRAGAEDDTTEFSRPISQLFCSLRGAWECIPIGLLELHRRQAVPTWQSLSW